MSSLDDPMMKRKYQKCKLRVKKWESGFMDKYGRKPSKNDIRLADSVIKESYKIYWKLKTQVLEETLLDITFDNDVQSNVSINTSINELLNTEVSLSSVINVEKNSKTSENGDNMYNDIGEVLLINTENIAPKNHNDKTSVKEYSSISPSKTNMTNVTNVWGDHLNKDKEEPMKRKSTSITRASSFQLSQKKFTSTSFTKRNPRKSLSMIRSKSKSDLNKSIVQTENTVDGKVLENDSLINDPMSLLFNDGIKLINQEQKVVIQSLNPIHEVLSGKILNVDRKLDLDWVDRCTRDGDYESLTITNKRLSGVSDSGIESIGTYSHDLQENSENNGNIANTSADVSDDDFVCNSDTEEEENRNKRIRNWKKMLSDMSLQQAKRPRLELSENNSSLYSNHTPQLNKQSLNISETSDECTNIVSTSPFQETNIDKKLAEYDFIDVDDQVQHKTNDESSKNKVISNVKTQQKISRKISERCNDTDGDNYEEGKIEESKTKTKRDVKKPTDKTTRTRRNKFNETKVQKPAKRTTRRTRNKTRNVKIDASSGDDDLTNVDEIVSTESKIPIYSIESLNVVPRFAVPQDSNGDLVSEFCQSINAKSSINSTNVSTTNPKSTMTPKEKLEAKIAAGKVNENFVRINLKKKVFVRGKKSFNYSRYKKNQWKHKRKELASGEGSLDLADLAEKNTCFKCGGTNHFARKCPAMKSDDLLPLEETEMSEYPTLDQAKKMALQEAARAHSHRAFSLPTCSRGVVDNGDAKDDEKSTSSDSEDMKHIPDDLYDDDFDDWENEQPQASISSAFSGHKIPKELIDKLLPPMNGAIKPLYQVSHDGSVIETPNEVFAALKKFGHDNFRPGQEKAVMRILSGQSTLVTLTTGSGKSLCYQLPAYLYAKRSRCITLVVSPLVSLMDDQVTGVPGFISAAALHTSQTPKVREKIVELVKDGNLDILLISPEAIVAGEKSTGFGSLLRQLPPIAFACIDEAHCISQWSHNFRPSYLMLSRVLTEKLGIKTILGLTATATLSTAGSIVNHLRVNDGLNGIISNIPVPNNLSLTVSKDEFRDRALVELLRSSRLSSCNSIIVYCTRRDECIRIAGLLRISLQETEVQNTDKPKSRAKVSPIAEAYHAGLVASRRKIIQKAFMSGQIRIVVATVAFGMGINKSDIRSVIHYNMPRSFESYVQEVGRAGRDQLPAHCHLFISPNKDQDKWELRRHIYADGVDRHTIRKLLQRIFVPCSCPTNFRKCPGHEVAIPIDETVRALDVSEETISTLLCYLELHPKKFITVLSSVYCNARVSSYNGARALRAAAQMSPPLAMAIALDRKKGISHDDDTVIEFPVVDVAAAIGWDSGVVKSHLKNLEWETIDGKPKRSALSVRFDNLGVRVRAPGDLNDSELDEALDALAERTQSQQTTSLQQLEIIYAILNKFSCPNIQDCAELTDDNIEKSEGLKHFIREYFQSRSPLENVDIHDYSRNDDVVNEAVIVSDIRSLISCYRDNNFSGRAVARIFHGIQSPNYSALTWSRCKFWRAHLAVDFNWIVKIATREILAMR